MRIRLRFLAPCIVWTASSLVLRAQTPQPAAGAPAGVQTQASQSATTPKRALELLKEGNARFAAGHRDARDYPAQVRATAPGQYPFGAVLSCMDSRVPVEILFDRESATSSAFARPATSWTRTFSEARSMRPRSSA